MRHALSVVIRSVFGFFSAARSLKRYTEVVLSVGMASIGSVAVPVFSFLSHVPPKPDAELGFRCGGIGG